VILFQDQVLFSLILNKHFFSSYASSRLLLAFVFAQLLAWFLYHIMYYSVAPLHGSASVLRLQWCRLSVPVLCGHRHGAA
jgi:hypothetical protein